MPRLLTMILMKSRSAQPSQNRVAVEKLFLAKFAKMKSRQDAL
jgi:hypothetical protein